MQAEFDTLRAGASLPYTCAMLGFGFSNIAMGRIADRYGILVPVMAGGLLLGAGLCRWPVCSPPASGSSRWCMGC